MPMQATTTTPLFAAELTPHRTLSARGARSICGLGVLFVALPALSFSALGVIPAAILMVLDALAIGAVVFFSLRPGKRRQHISVWAEQLEWLETDARGEKTLRRFDPKMVRLVLERDHDEKTIAMYLRNGSTDLEVGAFLNSEDKSSFAKALGTALRKARG